MENKQTRDLIKQKKSEKRQTNQLRSNSASNPPNKKIKITNNNLVSNTNLSISTEISTPAQEKSNAKEIEEITPNSTDDLDNNVQHIKNIVVMYQTKFLNSLDNEKQKEEGLASLKNVKVKVENNCALVSCTICEFVSKAYSKFENNRCRWILSNINRHFKTHFKNSASSKTITQPSKKLKNTTLLTFLKPRIDDGETWNSQETMSSQKINDNGSVNNSNYPIEISDSELDSAENPSFRSPLNEFSSPTRLLLTNSDPWISGKTSSTYEELNETSPSSRFFLQNPDPLVLSQISGETEPTEEPTNKNLTPEKFSTGRITFEENSRITSDSAGNEISHTNIHTPRATPTRRQRLINQRQLTFDINQPKITSFYEMCENIKQSVAENLNINLQFESAMKIAMDSMSKKQDDVPLTFFDLLKQAALRNTKGKEKVGNRGGSRFSEEFKHLCLYIFLTAGRLVYETLYANMSNGLPSITTLKRSLSKFENIAEGELNLDGLKLFLEKRNYPPKIIVSEDQTAIVKRHRYNAFTNQLVGCVPVVSKINSFPLKDQYKITSVTDIKNAIDNNNLSNNAYVYMAQPLVDGAPAYCISIFGSDNRFTADNVNKRWKYILDESKKRNITVVGFSSDGDTRCLKAMKTLTELPVSKGNPILLSPYSPYFHVSKYFNK